MLALHPARQPRQSTVTSPELVTALLPCPPRACVWRSPGAFLVKSLMFYSRAFREEKCTQGLMIHFTTDQTPILCSPKKFTIKLVNSLYISMDQTKPTDFCLWGILSSLSMIHLLGPLQASSLKRAHWRGARPSWEDHSTASSCGEGSRGCPGWLQLMPALLPHTMQLCTLWICCPKVGLTQRPKLCLLCHPAASHNQRLSLWAAPNCNSPVQETLATFPHSSMCSCSHLLLSTCS